MNKYFKRAAVSLLWLTIVPAVTLICGFVSLSLYIVVRAGLKNRTAFRIMELADNVSFIELPYCIKHGEDVRII